MHSLQHYLHVVPMAAHLTDPNYTVNVYENMGAYLDILTSSAVFIFRMIFNDWLVL